jgi:Zn-dependent membrane protease YugP
MPLTTEDLIIIISAVIILFITGQATIKNLIIKHKYNNKKNSSQLSGIEVARKILDNNDLKTTYILENTRWHNSYYDINKKIIRLDSTSFNGDSLIDVGSSIHQVGYALLDKDNNTYLKIRCFLMPIINIASYIGYCVVAYSIFMGSWNDLKLAVLIMGIVIIFHLCTLPLEYKVTKRIIKELDKLDIMDKKEIDDMNTILEVLNYKQLGSLIWNIINII